MEIKHQIRCIDNNNSYYSIGYSEGLANANSGTVVYKYHHHTSECAATCNAYYTRSIVNNLGNNTYTANVTLHHPKCGKPSTTYYWTVHNNEFNNQSASHTYYTCGYEEGEIIGAEIEFN